MRLHSLKTAVQLFVAWGASHACVRRSFQFGSRQNELDDWCAARAFTSDLCAWAVHVPLGADARPGEMVVLPQKDAPAGNKQMISTRDVLDVLAYLTGVHRTCAGPVHFITSIELKDQRPPKAMHAHARADPLARARPVNWLLGLFASGLLVWGVSDLLLKPKSEAPPSASSAITNLPMNGAIATDGTQIFASRCASCHQATGAGRTAVFPPLAGSEWVNGEPKQVVRILLLGMTGEITVSGSTYDGSMPAFGTTLSDAEIAAISSHVRSNFGNRSTAVTVDLVETERAALGNRTAPWAGERELKNAH